MRALRVATLIVLGGLFLGGAAVPPQQPAAVEALTNETLIKLVKAGLRDDVIIAVINSQPGQYSVNRMRQSIPSVQEALAVIQ